MNTARYFKARDWEKLIDHEIFILIHRFNSDETNQEFLGGMTESETTDRELAEG